ncbi:type I restriction-modification system subunit M [Geothermobacter hydrogeniphilus]|uniref:site-specific DNA-methyltransferase (adenine-specific) n=1 Tax=Geothermobacter hydrogeniphilus TaxID=1969733 RepID=A0A1X0XLH7_9BACT|nr:class I SAM-dependent DNA methyltransferase [Geothermobacter hydrogeniphilus]ORJ53698.1 DNA methyltransferase [Geothermobacter hydrogeniphilus]
MTPAAIVQKLWNFCNVLRDDGMSYGDYVEQLTYLLFLKMADERTRPPYNQKSNVPADYAWPTLVKKDGDELFDHYRHTLEALGNEKGLLGLIFSKSQNKFQDPAKLRRLIVDLIDRENWSVMSADVKGDAYEGLLEKNAQDTKSGAGQYFTPRPLIQAIVDCIAPKPGETICDPACGTGGFLLAAHDSMVDNFPHMTKDERKKLKEGTFKGWELVQSTARLCAMNLMLHGIGGTSAPEGQAGPDSNLPLVVADSLAADPGDRFNIILTNPPFGKKSSTTIVAEDGKVAKEKETVERDDFWATTSNKQLNFIQHVKTLLKQHGRAAVVVPDNVLFEGGAGETIRRKLLHECDVHTLLRLPTGLFYAQGVKANVLFFDRKPASETPWTKKLWIYDLRTNKHFTLKTSPLKRSDLDEFVELYTAGIRQSTWCEENPDGRWRCYDYEELVARDKASLDIFWLKDDSLEDSDNLPEPGVIAAEIAQDLEAALEQFRLIAEDLGEEDIPAE